MIMTILTILIALYWLMRETDWLRVRLLIGAPPILSQVTPEPIPEVKPESILLLAEYCEMTRIQKEIDVKRYGDAWRYGTPYNTRRSSGFQSMTIGNQTITLRADLPNLYDLIAECYKAYTDKPHKPNITAKSGKGSHRTVEEYKTVFRDCLPGKEWLEAHYKDEYPEPTIEITVDGGKSISLDGNYKQGMIKGFMSEYTERVRAGKKMMTISKGNVVVNCGGGVYINVNPEQEARNRELQEVEA